MFTGIIQSVGTVLALEALGDDMRIRFHPGTLGLSDTRTGDSIAVNGVCLTVLEKTADSLSADVSGETLSRTTLGSLRVGTRVNLERALTLSTPLGGHLVSGHVDGTGTVLERWDDGRSVRFRIEAPPELAHYIAEKGSICLDGISLTVNQVDGAIFEVNIIPHTLRATTMGEFTPGRSVNLEVDIIARYLERLVLGEHAADPRTGGTEGKLAPNRGS